MIRGAVIGIKENVYFQAADAVWRLEIAHIHTTRGAECPAYRDHNVQREHRRRNPGFGFFGLPRIWSASGIPDWGGLLSREGRQYMEIAPRLAFWPGLCLTITVFSLNMFGDAVRDLLDPRLRGGGARLG